LMVQNIGLYFTEFGATILVIEFLYSMKKVAGSA
jgi:hypothetical protein